MMPSNRLGSFGIDASRWVSNDSVRNPWAMVTFHGDIAAARSGSTWMNWWSSVTSANWSIRSWVTSIHSPVPSVSPTAARYFSYAFSAFVAMAQTLCRRAYAGHQDPGSANGGERARKVLDAV